MRKQLAGVFLPLLMVITAAAETQSTGTEATKHAALQKISVVRGDDGISVELTAHGSMAPKLATLASPARLVLDLPNTVPATSQKQIEVGRDGVNDIRIGTDGKAMPTTRVVIDLVEACRYELLPVGDKIILKLHSGVSETAAMIKADGVSTPAAKTADHAMPRVVMASATPATETVALVRVPTNLPKVPVSSVPEHATAAPALVVVEPTFRKKADMVATQPEMATSGRVVTAATRFVDKPDTNLLPIPSSAMSPQAQAAGTTKLPEPAVNMAAEQKTQQQQQQGTAAAGVKYTGEPISVNLKDVDLKDFFRLIHEISGLNIVLDPNVKGSLTIVLDDVPWDQALDIVLKNNDLARQLDGNVLRIATVDTMHKEADARRGEKEAEALAVDKVSVTRFLGYAHSKDVLPLVKKFLTSRGDVVSDDRTNALIISDIPAVMPNLDRLLTQLDRKTQEVEIEARVVNATRSFSRALGAQTGFEWFNGTSTFSGDNSVGSTLFHPVTTTSATGTSTTTGFSVPLFGNFPVVSPSSGFSFSNITKNYALDLTLEAAEKRGLAKVLSRPRVVTQNNISAMVKQGQRIPVVTASQFSGPPTVTYIEAVLRMTVVPQITAENTIFLNVDVENTTPDFSNSILGNPTLNTQQATTQVLVADGGTVVIGGIMQTNNSVNVSQIPVLGNIPYLGNLFKLRSVSTNTNELLFFITPRIIQD